MSEKPPSWRQYDAPGDEPGERIEPDAPEPTSAPPNVGAAPFVPYGDPHHSSTTSVPPFVASSHAGHAVGVIVGVVASIASLAVAVGVGIFFVAGDDGIGGIGGGGSPDMHTQEALDELIADLEEEHGSSEVFDATFYPDRAYVNLHVPGGNGQRYDSYTWDGDLGEWGSSSTDAGQTFELADVDGSSFDTFCDVARSLVEDPGDCYIIVDPDDMTGKGGFYSAYVSNDYGEGGYVQFNKRGEEVNRVE